MSKEDKLPEKVHWKVLKDTLWWFNALLASFMQTICFSTYVIVHCSDYYCDINGCCIPEILSVYPALKHSCIRGKKGKIITSHTHTLSPPYSLLNIKHYLYWNLWLASFLLFNYVLLWKFINSLSFLLLNKCSGYLKRNWLLFQLHEADILSNSPPPLHTHFLVVGLEIMIHRRIDNILKSFI